MTANTLVAREKPETFIFLGFTLVCGKTRRSKFQIKRKSRRDRYWMKKGAILQERSAWPFTRGGRPTLRR